jgi:uncharacterized pyridoxamine 5'-phosphate oxidase family protein
MNYFDFTEKDKRSVRMQTIFLMDANLILSTLNADVKTLRMVGMIKHLERQALKKEHYEMAEMLKDILKNKEYKIYE